MKVVIEDGKMTREMGLFRKMLDDNGIEWHDASEMDVFPAKRESEVAE